VVNGGELRKIWRKAGKMIKKIFDLILIYLHIVAGALWCSYNTNEPLTLVIGSIILFMGGIRGAAFIDKCI